MTSVPAAGGSARGWLIIVIMLGLVGWSLASDGHRSGCHRWHSCPSDRGTYTCGDLGYCSECLDNQYCLAGQPRTTSKPSLTSPKPSAPQVHVVKVRRVIDGDTLELDNGEDVRLIGVDTPETKHPKKPVERFGKEAAAFTKRFVEGQEVRLQYDQQL
jgi:Staphylococcal nuclease homologue